MGHAGGCILALTTQEQSEKAAAEVPSRVAVTLEERVIAIKDLVATILAT